MFQTEVAVERQQLPHLWNYKQNKVGIQSALQAVQTKSVATSCEWAIEYNRTLRKCYLSIGYHIWFCRCIITQPKDSYTSVFVWGEACVWRGFILACSAKGSLGAIWQCKLLPHMGPVAGRVRSPWCHTLSFQIKLCKARRPLNFLVSWTTGPLGHNEQEVIIGPSCWLR